MTIKEIREEINRLSEKRKERYLTLEENLLIQSLRRKMIKLNKETIKYKIPDKNFVKAHQLVLILFIIALITLVIIKSN